MSESHLQANSPKIDAEDVIKRLQEALTKDTVLDEEDLDTVDRLACLAHQLLAIYPPIVDIYENSLSEQGPQQS